MIQRKQTLFMLAIVALTVTMLFTPLATLTEFDSTVTTSSVIQNEITLDVFGVYNNAQKEANVTSMTILVWLIIGVTFVNIFLYRKRLLQLRLCFVIGIMLVGLIAFEVMYIYKLYAIHLEQMAPIRYSVIDLFPLFSLVCCYFAYRGVARDIMLIRSLDRIR